MDFKLPDIGEGIHEGEITKWLVRTGDKIKSDQPMVEVMTDKATVEIPSPVSGVVENLFAELGQTIVVGSVLLTIREEGTAEGKAMAAGSGPSRSDGKEASAPLRGSTPAEKQAPEANPDSVTKPMAEGEVIPFNILATPATRKLSRELHIDLRTLTGSGPHGRITKMDVQMAYEGQQAAVRRPSHPAPASVAMTIPGGPTEGGKEAFPRGALERIPLRGIRKKIAESMSHSKRTAAHFTYVEEVDMTEIVKLRESVKEEAKMRGIKITYLPFIIKSMIPALKEFPFLNASLDDERQEILLKGDYNIGIATDTPQGLMVPVVKNADQKSIWELAEDIARLAERARTGKSSLEDLKGGTFTITNAGTIGGVFATPVIHHPEVAILGVNAIRKRPVVMEDRIVIREMMFLSISIDHRVVDGASAARFMNRLVYFLSAPTRLVFA